MSRECGNRPPIADPALGVLVEVASFADATDGTGVPLETLESSSGDEDDADIHARRYNGERSRQAAINETPGRPAMQGTRQSHVTFAITIAMGAAAYLHYARGGMELLLSWPGVGFLAGAALLAPFTLGAAAYGLHRLLARWAGSDPQRLRQAAMGAQAVLIAEVVGGYYLVKTVFGWVYGEGGI